MYKFNEIVFFHHDEYHVNLKKMQDLLNDIKTTKNYNFAEIYNSEKFTNLNYILKLDSLTNNPIYSMLTCLLNTPDKTNTTLLIHALKNRSKMIDNIIDVYGQHCNIEHIDNNNLTSFDYVSMNKMFGTFEKLMEIYFKIQLLECDGYEFIKEYTLNNVLYFLLQNNKIELMEKILNLLIKYECIRNPYFDTTVLNCDKVLFYICEKNLSDIALLILNNRFVYLGNAICNKKCILIRACKNNMSSVAIKILELVDEQEFNEDNVHWNTTLLNVMMISYKNKLYDVVDKIIELFDWIVPDVTCSKDLDDEESDGEDVDDEDEDGEDEDGEDVESDGEDLDIVIAKNKCDSCADSDSDLDAELNAELDIVIVEDKSNIKKTTDSDSDN